MKLFVDSDFLVGLFRDKDPHHIRTTKIMTERHGRDELMASNLVLQETATVLSHRIGMSAVRLFWDKISSLGLTIVYLEKESEEGAWEIFLRQTKKGCSFVDCANLAVIERYKLDGILTFDEFYPKAIRIGA